MWGCHFLLCRTSTRTRARIVVRRSSTPCAQMAGNPGHVPGVFALGQVRGLPVASAFVINEVHNEAATVFRVNNRRAGEILRELFTATIAFLSDIQ